VPAVMTASQKRVIQNIIAAVQGLGDQMESEQVEDFQIDALPTGSSVSLFPANDPRSLVADELIKTLGERRAIEALVAAAYGNELDPSRYGPIVDLQDRPVRSGDRGFDRGRSAGRFGDRFSDRMSGNSRSSFRERDGRDGSPRSSEGPHRRAAGDRVYIGVGRRHGVSARDVAGLLMRAGGVPGRLVDGIEVRDYCAYATLPAEAARRAYDFAKRDPEHPTIKPAGKGK